MKALLRAWHRVRKLFLRSREEREMMEEFASHIEMQTQDNLRLGMDPHKARREALIKFGSMQAAEEAWRDQRGLRWVEETVRDLRLGLYALQRNPSFAAVTILTLGVTIGLNLAIYSVVQRVLLQPLPFKEPDRLVTLYNSFPGSGAERLANNVPDFFLRRERVMGLEEVALYVGSGENVGEGDRVERVPGLRVTPSFFPTLGVAAALGRTFLEQEMDPGGVSPVILTDGYWRERFEASPDVLGRTLEIDGRTATVVGVLPASFSLPTQPEARLVRPLVFTPQQRSLAAWGSNNDFFMLGRLAPGTSREQLEAELASLYRNVAYELRGEEGGRGLEQIGFRTIVADAHQDLTRNVRLPLFLLWGAVSFVLLIGCVNIANLMLARSEARLPEMATRAALGAGRLRLVRQILGEAILIGVLGGVVGIGLASIVLPLLGVVELSPTTNTDGDTAGAMALDLLSFGGAENVERDSPVGLSASVLAYSVALAVGASILFGVIPIVNLFRKDLNSAFTLEGRGRTRSRRGTLLHGSLVAGQVAMAFLLLVGAGLMLRSFQHVVQVDPGFHPDGVFTGYTALTNVRYPDGQAQRGFYDRLLGTIRALPGVEAASVTSLLPFGPGDRTMSITPVGYEPRPGQSVVIPNWSIVSPGYFDALGIGMLEGRLFEDLDGPGQQRVIIVDDWLAKYFWPDRSALGRQIRLPFGNETWTVIGVVESVKLKDLASSASDHVGAFYLTYRQVPIADMALVVKGANASVSIAESVRAALTAQDPNVPLFDARMLDLRLNESLASRRTPMILLLGFAAIAVFLAAVGTYGVLAYSVALRSRETAIRMALGSRPVDILAMVLKQGVVMAALGLAAGAIAVAFMVRWMQSLLFGVEPLDPLVLGATAAVLALSVVLACVVPARRATRVDPMRALTQE
jgi:predicted permease